MFRKLSAGSFILALGLSAGVAFAQANDQAQPGSQPGSQGQAEQGTQGTQGGQVQGQTKANLTATERQFLETANKSNLAEIQLGQLAIDHGQSDDVKSFGRRLVQDHQNVEQSLKDLAQRKGVTLTDQMSAKDKNMIKQLSSMSGKQFDTRYLTDMVQLHTADVAEFERMAKNAKDADIKAFAQQTVPTLRDHLQEAKTLQAQMKRGAGAATQPGQGGMQQGGGTQGGMQQGGGTQGGTQQGTEGMHQGATPQGTQGGTQQGTQPGTQGGAQP